MKPSSRLPTVRFDEWGESAGVYTDEQVKRVSSLQMCWPRQEEHRLQGHEASVA